jgi:4a-hydroxytetrahydrobiopterin dehydratase
MDDLAKRQCLPCNSSTPRLSGADLTRLHAQLGRDWEIVEGKKLRKEYQLPDFASALALVNRIGVVAETEGHHPDLGLGWGRVTVEIWTHAIDGLSESDFILAAKIESLGS